MTIKEIQELYDKGWLGVQLAIPIPVEVKSEISGRCVTLEPNYAYEVTYLSIEYMAGVLKVDEENSIFFKLDGPVKFLNIHSDILN